MRVSTCRIICIVAAAAFVQAALAQQAPGAQRSYPTKSIRLVVPYAAGGGPDVVGRILTEKMSQSLGQNIVIDNRGGAGGMVGTNIVAKAPPDGYTLLLQVAGYVSYPFFYKNLPYDPDKDLIPVSLVAISVGFVLAVNPGLGAASVKELVALIKANPGKFNFGTAGRGSPGHLAGELFAQMAGLKMTPVHYTGVPAYLADIIGGRLALGFPAAPSAYALMQAGRLRVLAITADKRWSKLPQLPTMHEAGITGYKFIGWYGLWLPAGTPAAIVSRIQSEVGKAVADPALRQRYEEQGLEAVNLVNKEFARTIHDEYELNRKLTTQIGIVPE